MNGNRAVTLPHPARFMESVTVSTIMGKIPNPAHSSARWAPRLPSTGGAARRACGGAQSTGWRGTGGARQPGASTSHSVDHPWSPRGGVTGHKKGENAVKSRSSWRDRREPGACAVGRQREPGGGPGCKRTFPGSKMALPPHLNIFLKSRMQAHNGACGPIARHCGGAGSNGRAGPISISLTLFCVDPEQGLTVSYSVPLRLKCGGEFGLFLGSFSN